MKRQAPAQSHPTQSQTPAIDWDSGVFAEGHEPYDAASPASIEAWGRRMEGQTFGAICEAAIEHGYDADLYEKALSGHGKGALGQLVEYYFDVLRELDFYHSQFWHKAHRMLLVWYEWKQDAAKRDYSIQRVFLFSPPRQDLPTIEKDCMGNALVVPMVERMAKTLDSILNNESR